MYPRIWLNWLVPPLRRYEVSILGAVGQRLSPPARALYERQLGNVNLVQRHSGGKEVNLYRIRRGRPFFEEASRFPNRRLSLRLARVTLKQRRADVITNADVLAVKGFVFSIVFANRPKVLSESTEILDVKLFDDPLESISEERAQITSEMLNDWRREWARKWKVHDIRPPLNPAVRDNVLKQLEAKLPDDYCQLLQDCDGLRIDHFHVLGAAEIYEVVLPDRNVYVLAKGPESCALVVHRGAFDGKIFFTDHEGQMESAAYSFREAIEAKITEFQR